MKALSLWQPWAEAMRRGLKAVETRGWPTKYRGPLAIHAAKMKFDPDDYENEFVALHAQRAAGVGTLIYGAVLCVVELIDCVPTREMISKVSSTERMWGNYGEGRWAWVTAPKQLIVLPEPLPLRGRQGLFEIPELYEIGKR